MNYKTYEVKVYSYGDKEWYLNGKLHREGGPAVECTEGTKYWFLNGKLHREDGPAIEYSNGDKSWYLNGMCYTEREYNQKIKELNKTCNGKVVEIDGKRYKLKEV